MKLIKILFSLTLFLIFFLQVMWLVSMYGSYKAEFKHTIEHHLAQAIEYELSVRIHRDKTPFSFTYNGNESDTARFVRRRIRSQDTTIYFTIDRHDPFSESKVKQCMFKDMLPLDVQVLDSVLFQMLSQSRFPVKETAIEYIDIEKDKILDTNKSEELSGFYETPVVPIDIIESIGVKAYILQPASIILKMMTLQLILSVVLIAIAAFCLYRLLKTIFQQQKKAKIQRDFVNAMTHEFKRPIGSALFMLSYAIEKLNNNRIEKVGEYLANSVLELKKLNLYSEKIQEISKGEEKLMEILSEPVNLNGFLNGLKEKYEKVGEKPVHISIDIKSNIILYTDPLHFSNIMDNLIENAIKYSGDSVLINIQAVQENGKIRISVKDNGWGISANELPYIFDKFYRGYSNEKRKQTGFGLGLSYIKAMMDSMKGDIRVNSIEGQFAEFSLYFINS